ncbi:MAG TPA: cation:proton antiporter [Anaerolineae bacterium]|nr:cation:proton antiporter [Anaerolineae bacterium]
MELSILNLLLVLGSALIAGRIALRLGYPSIFGELMAGIILGPPLLGLLESSEALTVLAEVGVILMMLYIGMEIDPEELFKASWSGLLAALGGFVTPFALAYWAIIAFGGTPAAGLFVGIAAGVTSLATKSRILSDLHLLDTRIAHVMMAGALVADTLSLIVFAGVIGVFETGTLDIGDLLLVGGKAALFFAVVFFIGLKLLPPFWEYLRKQGWTGRTVTATVVLLIALLFAEMAELAGLHAILGAFLAGLFLREGTVLDRKMTQELTNLVHDVSIGFLAPIFFVTAGFHVSLDVFQSSLPLLITVVLAATLGKIVGTALFYLPSGNGWREGVTIGAGMNGRGAVEIIIAEIGLQMGVISSEIFSILVFMAIITTAAVPLFLKWGSEWLKSRGELVRAGEERNGVVIVGAGPLARLIAQEIQQSQPVWLIDKNGQHCQVAREQGLTAVQGDALDIDALEEAQTATASTFLTLTPNAEVNVLSAQIARTTFRVPTVHIPLGTQNSALSTVLEEMNVEPLLDEWIDIDQWDLWLAQDDAKRVQWSIEQNRSSAEVLQEALEQRGSLPLIVKRDGKAMFFPTVKELLSGDEVLAVSKTTA